MIIVRTDLKMGRGKLATQVAHASVSAALKVMREEREWFESWLSTGQKKVVVKVDSEKELLEKYREALEKGLPTVLIRDAGLTQLPPGVATTVGIGPAPEELIDSITKSLKLL